MGTVWAHQETDLYIEYQITAEETSVTSPKISVAIPYADQGYLLAKAINSVLTGSPRFEVKSHYCAG